MARANTVTLLSLDRFFAILGIHPLHSNGVYVEDLAPVTGCQSPILQYEWQAADGIGREAIAEAIALAERSISAYLGFKLMPTWEVSEAHVLPPQGNPARGDWGYAISGGIEAKSNIQLAAGVAYSDEDNDGYYETATVVATLPTSPAITDVEEIAIYYPGHHGDDAWEIRPLRSVMISSGVVTIKLRREQLVGEDYLEGFAKGARGVDGLDDDVFLDNVDVIRHYHDPSQHVQLLWTGYGGCGCWVGSAVTCAACIASGQYGALSIRDNRLSVFQATAADWDATTETFVTVCTRTGVRPDRARLWYRAGWRNLRLAQPHIKMDPQWERAVAYFAASLLDRPLCACESTVNIMNYWRDDVALRESEGTMSRSFAVHSAVIGNPFGTTRGAVHAWRACQRERIGGAVCAL